MTQFFYAAMALEHWGCGQAQRSLRPLPSAASEQAWLQYFSPADTGQVQFGWAQRSWVASGMMGSLRLKSGTKIERLTMPFGSVTVPRRFRK